MASNKAVAQILNVLADSRPGSRLPDDDRLDRMIEAYALVLKPVPDDLLKRAAVLAARQPGDFLPSAGTLYDLALDLADDAPDSGEAWGQAWTLICRGEMPALDVDLSVPRAPLVVHPRVRTAVQALGGVGALQELDKKGLHRHQFEQAYKSLREEWKRKTAMEGFIGPERQLKAPRRGSLAGNVQQRDSD